MCSLYLSHDMEIGISLCSDNTMLVISDLYVTLEAIDSFRCDVFGGN